MNRLFPLTFAALAGVATPGAAATFDYDLLIVACDESSCWRIAEQTLAAGPGDKAEYRGGGLKLQIETVARRPDAVDARISVDMRPPEENAMTSSPGTTLPVRRVQFNVEPCTLKHGVFSAVASFVNAGNAYRVWARLASAR
ncbi:MAG: hypothetical protein Q7U97_04885 [Rhodocyclaceae bacterium]|nr:hypothetical protein [Rhodocyclaceae bacterium]